MTSRQIGRIAPSPTSHVAELVQRSRACSQAQCETVKHPVRHAYVTPSERERRSSCRRFNWCPADLAKTSDLHTAVKSIRLSVERYIKSSCR
ncbi:hypothetical protein AAFF_G00046730 [Aldrovandia affinis]|uniref:Uncharacterized protein n=1 Tax=Aldrovandia affinis TaxID=143900 RepID=A0AAD7S2C9_9TELE|nr:hypothetical protein AAFF_G00046730 [Aldrovandia affinis]